MSRRGTATLTSNDDIDRAILITGGSRGVGTATTRLAAERGYDVAFSYSSNRKAAQMVLGDIVAVGRRALTVPADSADAEAVAALFDAGNQSFG